MFEIMIVKKLKLPCEQYIISLYSLGIIYLTENNWSLLKTLFQFP